MRIDRATLAVAGDSAWLTFGLAVQGLSRLGFLALVGSLAPHAMPDVTAALALAMVATLVWPAAAGNAALRFSTTGYSTLHATLSRVTALVTAGTGLLAWPVMFAMTADPLTATWSAVVVAASAWYGFSRPALVGQRRVKQAVLADITVGVITLGAVSIILALGLDGGWWLAPAALGQVGACIVGRPPRAAIPGSRPHTERSTIQIPPDVLTFIGHNTVVAITAGMLVPVATLATRVFDHAEAGVFAAAISLATPINMLSQSLTQVLIPHFAQATREGNEDRLQRLALKLFVLSAICWVVLFGAALALADVGLRIAYSGNFPHAGRLLRFLLVATAINSLISVPTALLVATGRARLQSRIAVGATLAGLAVMALTPLFGVNTIMWGFAVGAGGAGIMTAAAAFTSRPEDSAPGHRRGWRVTRPGRRRRPS